MRPLDVMQWLGTLPLAPETKSYIKRVRHLLFERAMLWGYMMIPIGCSVMG
jgi:hypothetical protein